MQKFLKYLISFLYAFSVFLIVADSVTSYVKRPVAMDILFMTCSYFLLMALLFYRERR